MRGLRGASQMQTLSAAHTKKHALACVVFSQLCVCCLEGYYCRVFTQYITAPLVERSIRPQAAAP